MSGIYTPDKWVLIDITYDGNTTTKVLAGWAGSYMYGQSWKLNSGVTETKEFDDRYEFKGHTGSVYVCRKGSQGFNMIMSGIYDDIRQKVAAFGGTVTLKEI